MTSVFVAWIVSAVVMCVVAVRLGIVVKKGWLGILIDERGRFSLSRFQVAAWTLVVLSLIFGVFWGRLGADAGTALEFSIPGELLAVMGISVGSTVLATTIKTGKDNSPQAVNIAASDERDRPGFAQMFLVEEGAEADQVIDISKFQNFWITVVLLIAYVVLASVSLSQAGSPGKITALPGFGQQFVIFLAISHAGYLVGKVPNKAGPPKGLTVAGLHTGALPILSPTPTEAPAASYVPRNP